MYRQTGRHTDRQTDKENLMAIVCFNLYQLDKFSPKKACLERLSNEKAGLIILIKGLILAMLLIIKSNSVSPSNGIKILHPNFLSQCLASTQS